MVSAGSSSNRSFANVLAGIGVPGAMYARLALRALIDCFQDACSACQEAFAGDAEVGCAAC